jgi:hypothetical protein
MNGLMTFAHVMLIVLGFNLAQYITVGITLSFLASTATTVEIVAAWFFTSISTLWVVLRLHELVFK